MKKDDMLLKNQPEQNLVNCGDERSVVEQEEEATHPNGWTELLQLHGGSHLQL